MIEVDARRKLGSFSLASTLSEKGTVCLTGANGSGKSCLMQAIAGILPIDEGYVRIDGRDVTRAPPEGRGVVMVTPGSFIPHMSVDSHLTWGARLNHVRVPAEQLAAVKRELGIDFAGRVSHLSLGMRERVALGTALLSSPKAILVDEAFSNIHNRLEFVTSYRKLASDAGIDLVFSTQDRSDVAYADHLYIMTEGVAAKVS